MDDREDVPADGIRRENMSEKSGNVAQLVRLVSMDGVVVFGECLLEQISPQSI